MQTEELVDAGRIRQAAGRKNREGVEEGCGMNENAIIITQTLGR